MPGHAQRAGGARSATRLQLAVLFAVLVFSGAAPGENDAVRVAVAANFADTARVLVTRFEQAHSWRVVLSSGSTGLHYAQISNGAPFDVFLAADVERPALLEQRGLAVTHSRFTYAIGQLVLWSPQAGLVDADGAVLATDRFRYLAIANPRLAPYGRAAREVLEARGLWTAIAPRLVRGENIGQTFQFVASGNAELGFVALSQLRDPQTAAPGSRWLVPQALYRPIHQQAVLIRDGAGARALLAFLRSEAAKELIRTHGYRVP